MDIFNIVAILVTLTALFSYINYRYIGLPVSMGVLLIALAISLTLIALGAIGLGLKEQAKALLNHIDFDKTLIHGMLSFLLFAGALKININDLAQRKWIIASMSTIGTIMSMFLVGTLTWIVLAWVTIDLPYIYCLLFGALISPTDPIAVIAILKTAGASKSLETKIAGESLFNDGIGVVAFLVLLEIAAETHLPGPGNIAWLFAQEAIGGALFGLAIGYMAYRMLKTVENYQVELLITLALVTGGYALAGVIHMSGPIAIVVAGLLIGNQGRLLAMCEETRQNLDIFWELVDEVLNAVLFVLMGLEVLVLTYTQRYLLASLFIIPVVLFSRFMAVATQVTLLRPFRQFSPGAIRIMTWGGLRGGISVALALSLPLGPERDVIVAITYATVVFSILVQGLTMGKVVKQMVHLNEESTPR